MSLTQDDIALLAARLGAREPIAHEDSNGLAILPAWKNAVDEIMEDPDWRDWQSVPSTITLRQLILGMLGAEWITRDEAIAWSERQPVLPQFIELVIAQLPENHRDAARITARTMTEVDLDNPLIAAGAALRWPEMSEQQRQVARDEAFRTWANI